jgi:hypothetical protein
MVEVPPTAVPDEPSEAPVDPDSVLVEAPPTEAPEIAATEAPEDPDPTASAPAEVLSGKLMVTSDRRAAVFIDGKKIGITPLEGPLDIDAGTYEVRAVALKTGKSQRLQARVDAGKVLQVSFEFR